MDADRSVSIGREKTSRRRVEALNA